MALQGTIKDFGLPDIFQLIGLQRKTGILTLSNDRDKETVTVTFENGMVVMADSSGRRLEDRLGNVLVKQGKLSRERLEEALGVQKQTLQRLGHILATSSAITTRDLRDALQVQIAQIVFRVFRWRDGRYLFNAADTVDFDRENFVPMSADFILMEGIRMVDEWPIIEKKITSFDMVFRPVVDPSLIEVGAGTGPDSSSSSVDARGASATGKIRLGAEEERVFRKVDGVRTVQAIIDSTGSGEFEVCRTLFDFMNRNLIAPAGRDRTVQDERAEASAAAPAAPGYAVAALVSVLALAGTLVQCGSPFAVTGLAGVLPGTQDVVKDGVLQTRLVRLERAIEAWRATHGRPPTSLDDLVKAGLVERSYLFDPWSRRIRYEADASGYRLSASDEPGRPGASVDRRGGR
ncbi:MAG TPA: DUF4388 domain-containing protein [Vicinamibacteria bacterium]|jgi:hypothetical protein